MSFWNTFFLLLIYIPLIMIWAFALIDIFRRDDLHGGAKAAWLIVVIIIPFIGTLIYLIARKPGSTPEERAALDAAREGGTAAAPTGVDRDVARPTSCTSWPTCTTAAS